MIYITGDTHGNFRRFTKKQREHSGFDFTENDYVIVCGDFGLLWAKDREFEYNMDWLSRLPFTLLWVQGNHENYDMIAEYKIEQWSGGKARHIIRDKIILLERGQVFNIDGYSFFTFGGASSHDIVGGILDVNSPNYQELKRKAIKQNLPYRVLGYTWWKEELPSEEEMQEGLANLEKVGYKVDYVITHCFSSSTQELLKQYYVSSAYFPKKYKTDILTDYFDILEQRLQYKQWFCGHYHADICIGDKHTILFGKIVPLVGFAEYMEDEY